MQRCEKLFLEMWITSIQRNSDVEKIVKLSRRTNMKFCVLLVLVLFSLSDLSNGAGLEWTPPEIEGNIDDTMNIPEDKRTCDCNWTPWMNSGPVREGSSEDETYDTLRKEGFDFCKSPVDIQCYKHGGDPSLALKPGFSATCSVSVGLSCSLLCDDYSVRVGCCYCPPEATGPKFQISPKTGIGCFKAIPPVSGSSISTVSFSKSCDVDDAANLWAWVSRYSIKNIQTKQCLTIANNTVVLKNCDLDQRSQKWKYLDRSSTLQPYGSSGQYIKSSGSSLTIGPKASTSQWLAKVDAGKTSIKNMKNFPCVALEAPKNGALSCTFGEYVSSKCTFSCNYGYKLPEDIENPSECTDDGLFTVDSPVCKKIFCEPAINAIDYGTVTCSNGNNLDSSCIYKCDSGYVLDGSSQLTCLHSEEWDDAAPTCERVICSPDLKRDGIENGSVNCTNGAYYASKCTYSCREGYEMVGSAIRTCNLDETWDLTKPVCSKIECPAIVLANNSSMVCTDKTDYLSTCTFSCNAGYTMVGSSTSVCTADKTWGSEPPTCDRKTCHALSRDQNGDMFCDDGNFYASKCSFTCKRGFRLEGEESLKCTDEGWNYGAPTCTQITCSPQTNPTNGEVSCSNDEIYRSVCTFKCSHGFKLVGKNSTECREDGWSEKEPTCEQITCTAIANPRHGNFFCSKNNNYGSQCFVFCDTGYKLPSGTQGPFTCQLNGRWDKTPGTCKRIECPVIDIPFGLLSCTALSQYNSTCTFSCKDGYNRLGTEKSKCTETGWDPQPPSCGRLTCSPPLQRPYDGQIECTTSGLPVCTFSCNTGFTLSGASQSKCQNNEKWSVNEIPICRVNKCSRLPRTPTYGSMDCTNGVVYNSECSFECDSGYDLIGEPQTRCMEDRMWDRETPTCRKISCSSVAAPAHGTIQCTESFLYKTKCRFGCDKGYNLVGQETIECYHNSTWSGSPPYCQRITCSPPYQNPSNGRVNCTDLNNHHSKCTFTCENGFALEGTKVATCLDSGWNVKKPPTCKQITCPLDTKEISNGARRCSQSHYYESECTYTCNSGYELVGAKSSVCTGKGTWSNKAPTCKEVEWCPEIPRMEHGQVICGTGNRYDAECVFVCNEGYKKKPDIDTVKCMVNKRWKPAGFPSCEPVNITVVTTPTAATRKATTTTTESTTTSTTTTTTSTTSSTTTATTKKTVMEITKPVLVESNTNAPNGQISVPKSTPRPSTGIMATTAEAADTDPLIGRTTSRGVETNSEKDAETGGPPIIIIAAVAAVVVILIILIVIVIFCWRKKSRKRTKYGNGPSNTFKDSNRYYQTELGPLIPNGNNTIGSGGGGEAGAKKNAAISMERLEMEYNRRHADDDKLFREEYHSLVDGSGSKEAGGRAKNKDKNRYTNILPFDHSRVILPKVGIDNDSDYINASFVDGYKHKGKFIAAQGPKENTKVDFWRMIWEQNISTIIMATNLEERKELKCARYWPQAEPESYGDLVVANMGENHLVDYTIRIFSLQRIQADSTMRMKRTITQYHFTSWPDFGVPKSPSGILKFLRKIRHGSPTGYGPIIVHCSAGVGRTGTFICIDAMMDMIARENKIDVYSFCSQMRQQRPEMVQTEQQYIFIYQAILEHHLYGDTEVEASEVSGHIDELMKRLPGNVTGMEHDFKKLTSIRIQKEHMRAGNHPANMKKNRVLLILPYDWNRVMLPIKRGQENTDYINASYIDGYRQKDAYIATQGPLPHTVEDFWRMIWNSECASIVMLTELVERGQAKCAQYWPNEGSVTFGDVEVELVTSLENEDYTERDFKVTNASSNAQKQLIVKQFHYHGWPEVGAPVSGYSMIELVEAVQKQQQNSGNNPIAIHCSAGAGRTGAFCALTTALEQVKAEGVLDMFQIVKCLRMQRPHMVQNLEQYEFCYRAVQEYIDSMSEYCNFK